jgi:hypothetical protein
MAERSREEGFALHRRAQRRAWLRVDHRGRLEWLEEAKRFAARAIEAAATRKKRSQSKNSA